MTRRTGSEPDDIDATDDEIELFRAIREGHVEKVAALLDADPGLATSRLGSTGRTPLHVVTDWPGYFPHGPEVAATLIAAGAVVDDRGPDGRGETPLHWAASSDDAEVARVLIAHGADVEAADGSLGTPIENAVGYGCWNVARLLAASDARVDRLWVAAALGLAERMSELLTDGVAPGDLDQALWHACAGGQRRAAQALHELGASTDFTPAYATGTVLDAAEAHGTQRSNLIEWLEQLGVRRAEA